MTVSYYLLHHTPQERTKAAATRAHAPRPPSSCVQALQASRTERAAQVSHATLYPHSKSRALCARLRQDACRTDKCSDVQGPGHTPGIIMPASLNAGLLFLSFSTISRALLAVSLVGQPGPVARRAPKRVHAQLTHALRTKPPHFSSLDNMLGRTLLLSQARSRGRLMCHGPPLDAGLSLEWASGPQPTSGPLVLPRLAAHRTFLLGA